MAVWAKIMTSLRDHPKAIEAGPQAMWLYVSMILYAKERDTNGFFPVSQLSAKLHGRGVQQWAKRLTSVGLVHEVDGGFQIVKYDEKQGEGASLSAKRAKDADRKRRQRERERGNVTRDTPKPVAPLEQSRAEKSRTDESAAHFQRARGDDVASAITDVWTRYPHRRRDLSDIGLANRLEAVADTSPDTLARIAAALTEDLESADWQREDGRFIPKLSAWITDRRWDRATTIAGPVTVESLAASDDPNDRAVAELLSGDAT